LSRFGADAMAGFGIGTRIMQAIFLPGMAIAFAVPAIAGQNLGAGRLDRVGETMREALKLECAVMLVLTLVCKWQGGALVDTFTSDGGAGAVAREYLDVISWNFLAVGLVFACSGLFQAFGNAWPGLWSMVVRLLLFAAPALWLPRQPEFTTMQLWHVSVLTSAAQAAMSLWLLRRLWRRKAQAADAVPDVLQEINSA
jgi:Na+-driven multidrug efflux pump